MTELTIVTTMTSMQRNDDKYQHAISMLKSESLDLAVRKLQILSKEGDGHADAVLGALFEFGRGEIAIYSDKALTCYERSVASVGSPTGMDGNRSDVALWAGGAA